MKFNYYKIVIFSLIITFSFSSVSNANNDICQNVIEIPLSECEVIMSLYDSGAFGLQTHLKDKSNICAIYEIDCVEGHVKGLKIWDSKLEKIPNTISDLTQLEELDISMNPRLVTIAQISPLLLKLKKLIITHNYSLKEVPDLFTGVESLEIVFISFNNSLLSISNLYATLEQENIKSVSIGQNDLLDMPDEYIQKLATEFPDAYIVIEDNYQENHIFREIIIRVVLLCIIVYGVRIFKKRRSLL